MAEAARTGTRAPSGVQAGSGRGDAWRALGIFASVALAVGALYLASAALFADLSVFRDAGGRFGVVRIARFNATLGLVFAYLCASLWLGRRWVRRDFDELRGVAGVTGEDAAARAERSGSPHAWGVLAAAVLGLLVGAAIDFVGGMTSEPEAQIWRGHVVWIWILNPVLFAAMGMLLRASAARAPLYRELGRCVRVPLGDIAPLAPFARAGLRNALLWFLGTSLATLLLVDTDTPWLVGSILGLTAVIAVASLLAPSRGVHERLVALKREELTWLRTEIARASDALRRGDAPGAASLPALLSWESRVAAAPEWPFDTSVWMRFALFLLVPLGSWLGGALAQRLVDRWLGT